MLSRIYAFAILVALGAVPAVAQTAWQSFVSCITTSGTSGSPVTCTLPTGTYSIDGSSPYYPVAEITGSYLIVQGVQNGGDYPTLQRSGSGAQSLMTTGYGVSNVTIQYLNFDGNRYGVSGINCLGLPESQYIDLDSSYYPGANILVQYVNFLNSPATAADLTGPLSVIQYSQWAAGGPSQGSRWDGLYLNSPYMEDGAQAFSNYIDYSGWSGIDIQGYGNFIYGNILQVNRHEEGNNVTGGQIFVTGDWAYIGATLMFQYGYQLNGSTVNGCATESLSPADGIEVTSSNPNIFDIGSYSHTGALVGGTTGGVGMLIDPGTYGLYMAGPDPWDPSDTLKDMFNNSQGGIYASPSDSSYLTFYQIQSSGNGGWGVYLDAVNYVTFSAGVCLTSNTLGTLSVPGSTNITYPTNYSYNCE